MESKRELPKPTKKRKMWTKEEIKILRKHYAEYSVEELIKKFKLDHSIRTVKKKIFTLNLPRKHKSWTKEEIESLLKLVEQYPYNLREACRLHASKYNRNSKTVENKFFSLRKNTNIRTCMMTIGKHKHILNRKNVYKGINVTPIKTKISKWKKILSILFE